MAFQPGHKKAGGRKAGTPNKASANFDAEEIAKQLNFNPFEVMAHFALGNWKALGYQSAERVVAYTKSGEPIYGDTITPETRLNAAKEASMYLMSKRSAIQLTVQSDVEKEAETFQQLPKDQQIQIMEQEIKRLKGEA